MEYKWIWKKGNCKLEDISGIINELCNQSCKYISMYTDEFKAGIISENLSILIRDELLELRLFCDEYELLFTRGYIGCDFFWRITRDKYIDSDGNEVEADYLAEEQFIDINDKVKSELLPNGNMSIMSIVGGSYSLPIKYEKKIKIKHFIDYDENGMAKVMDSRICDFV